MPRGRATGCLLIKGPIGPPQRAGWFSLKTPMPVSGSGYPALDHCWWTSVLLGTAHRLWVCWIEPRAWLVMENRKLKRCQAIGLTQWATPRWHGHFATRPGYHYHPPEPPPLLPPEPPPWALSILPPPPMAARGDPDDPEGMPPLNKRAALMVNEAPALQAPRTLVPRPAMKF